MENKTNEKLIQELDELRQRFTELGKTVADRKRIEEKVVHTEQIYRQAIIQTGGVPYQRNYATPGYDFIGEEIATLTGYSPEEMTGELFTNRLRKIEYHMPESDQPHEELLRRARIGLIPLWQADYLFEKKNGTFVWLSDASVPVRDDSGNTIGSLGILTDITHHKNAEEALRESEERFKAQYQGNPTPTFTWRKKGEDFELVDYNDAAKVITNERVSQFLGKTATELYRDREYIL